MPEPDNIFTLNINTDAGLYIESRPTDSLIIYARSSSTRWLWLDVLDPQKLFAPPEGQTSGRYEVCTCGAWCVVHMEPMLEDTAWHFCAFCHKSEERPCIWKVVS